MRRRELIGLVGGAAAWPLAARSQQTALPVVGYLNSRGPDDASHLAAAFRRGLRDSGYIDGQTVRIEYRWAHGRFERLPAMAQELARLPVAVMVAGGGEPAALAAKAATSTIPIVFSMGSDPVKLGLAASYNRPGGNVTGIDILTATLEPKRLRLLHDLVPAVGTIGFLVDRNFPPAARQIGDVQEAARAMSIRTEVLQVAGAPEIDIAFETIAKQHIRALAVGGSPFLDTRRQQIVGLAARHAVPAIYHFREFAEAGGLMSYGIDILDVYRQVGLYAGRILSGAKPADMPITLPTKFDLVINLKTVKTLGLTVPPGLLSIVDGVIE